MKIQVKAKQSPFTKGGKSVYSLNVVNAGKVSADEFAEAMGGKLSGGKAEATMLLTLFKETITAFLLKNYRVTLSNFASFGLSVKGSLEHIGDQPNKVDNPVHAVINLEGETKALISALEVENVTEGVDAKILGVQEVGCAVVSTITTKNVNINISGVCLDLDTTKTDEFVALEDTLGVQKFQLTVVSHSPTLLVVKIPESATLPEDGTYRLAVHGRNGMGSEYSPCYATYGVTVAAAA